jgi:hypothetical protein
MSKGIVGSKFDGFLGCDQQYIYSRSFVHPEIALRFISLLKTVQPGRQLSILDYKSHKVQRFSGN